MAKILGIDLGTTYSEMAIFEGGQPKILENKEGSRTTPSVVAISKNGERLVGILAKRQAITNPQNTIFSAKRLIGRRFSDPVVQKDKALLPYEIREASNGGVEIKMGDRWYKPEEISAMVLQKLKQDAEERLGTKIEEAIITVPAYFDDSQRQATKNAGEIAGFKVRRILNEPTAAAVAYGFNKKEHAKLVVFDFGGGTLDVSVIEVVSVPSESGEHLGENITVLGTGGDTHLGGDDFDQRITDWIISEFKKENGIDLSRDSLALQRIKEAAEKAKCELSTLLETEINLPFITSDASGPKHLLMKLTRSKFNELTRDLVDRSIERLNETLKEINLKLSDINEIILVGGTTRIPAIFERIKEVFGKEPKKDINPEEVVAMGAAIIGGALQGDIKDILLLDVTPLTLSIETLGGVATPMIPKNSYIPIKKTQIFSTASDNQTAVEIHVVSGERPMAQDNKSLARFILDGIPPAPRGVPQIEVTFDIDSNGILNVTAVDKATGRQQSVRVEATTALTKEEVERLKREAEKFAEEDRRKKELIEVQNTAENLIYTAQKSLNDAGDKIPTDLREKIKLKIDDLVKAKETNDLTTIKNAMEDLSRHLSEIGTYLYGSKNQTDFKGDTSDSPDQEPPAEGPVQDVS